MSLEEVARRYAVAVSPHLLSLLDPADPSDPIARQFLPSLEELTVLPDERADPIGDAAHSPVPGIVHRHPDRVLFKAVAACPVYCRFCFRREMIGPGHDNALSKADFEAALAYIAADPQIWEVILTGGDPFILSPRRMAEITGRLGTIAHVKVIRWHTRVPVTDPERVSDDMVAALHAPGATTYVAVHANHSREFSAAAKAAIARLVEGGVPLISQSVLLKGVNDDVETLADLMRAFV
ncbi:MAG: radical SAM protein, partial [Burkholderia sp.]|nr:radical SAM protein [Burkholderia sp.]